MIDLNTLTTLSTLDPLGLSAVLKNSGYEDAEFDDVVFVGINKSGAFVYETEYDDDISGVGTGCVFVTYDHERGVITADY